MAEPPLPSVRTLILCEEVSADPARPGRISLLYLVSTVRAAGGPVYPALLPQLCLFAQLTECRGAADLWVDVREENTGGVVHRTPTVRTSTANDPLAVRGVTIRMRNLVFPRPGLYAVRLWFAGRLLGDRPLVFR